MISRVAEHCFWMSRYLERAENTARVLEVNQTLLLDLEAPIDHQWKPLLIISGVHDMPGEPDAETVQNYLTWETDNPSSIASSMSAARENARIIREVISADMWERINYYHLWMSRPAARGLYDRARSEFYNQIKRINQLIHGIGEGTMSHGEAWEFFRLGKYLERACQTARILDVKYHILLPTPQQVGTPVDNAHWVAILASCSGYEPYQKQLPGAADPGVSVADFLIFDPLFPRSRAPLPARMPGGGPRHRRRPAGRSRGTVAARPDRLAGRREHRRIRPGRPARGAHHGRQQHPQDRRSDRSDVLRRGAADAAGPGRERIRSGRSATADGEIAGPCQCQPAV